VYSGEDNEENEECQSLGYDEVHHHMKANYAIDLKIITAESD